jgi:hypothetical protein
MLLDTQDKEEALFNIKKALEYLWKAQDLITHNNFSEEELTFVNGLLERVSKRISNVQISINEPDEE